jgi:hypothetical protein
VLASGNGNWQMGARLLVADGSATAPHFLSSHVCPPTSSLLRPPAPVGTASAFSRLTPRRDIRKTRMEMQCWI